MAPPYGPNNRPGQNRPGGKQQGQRGPVFKEITWLRRWPRLIATGFVLLILVEIMIFVWVAERIGLGLTLLALLGSAAAGLWLIRRTGLDMVGRLRLALAQGQEPGHSLVDGACFVIAGLLLIVPGFFTDLLALLLMLPGSRNWLIRRFAGAFGTPATGAKAGSTVITDVEFREVQAEAPGAAEDATTETAASPAEGEILVPTRPDAGPHPDRAAAANPRPAVIDVEAEEPAGQGKPAATGPVEGEADKPAEAEPDRQQSGPQEPDQKKAEEKKVEDWATPPRRPIIDVEES